MLEPVWPTTIGERILASLLRIAAITITILALWTLWAVFTTDYRLVPAQYQEDFIEAVSVVAYWAWASLFFAIAIFIGLDAAKLGAHRGRLGRAFSDIGPFAWFFVSAVIPILGIVAYLFTRPRLRDAWEADNMRIDRNAVNAHNLPLVAPPSTGDSTTTTATSDYLQIAPPALDAGYCTQCGKKLNASDVFCGACGTRRN